MIDLGTYSDKIKQVKFFKPGIKDITPMLYTATSSMGQLLC